MPLLRSQIEKGGPVIITDPDMTRFVMSVPNAVALVLRAAEMSLGGEVFVLKMPALRVGDLAEVMIKELAPKYGHVPGSIAVQITGKRQGEKDHEELLTEDEAVNAYETDGMFVIGLEENQKDKVITAKRYTSNDGKLLRKTEIKEMLIANLPYFSEIAGVDE